MQLSAARQIKPVFAGLGAELLYQALGLLPGDALTLELLCRLDRDGIDNLEAYISNSADSTITSFRFDTIRWVVR